MTRQHFGLVSSVVVSYHNRLKEDRKHKGNGKK